MASGGKVYHQPIGGGAQFGPESWDIIDDPVQATMLRTRLKLGPESFSSIDSWDAAHYHAVRNHYEEKKTRRAVETAEATATAMEVAQDV
eukprot:jgi/Tetstr1/465723/TSEL_010348.t1